MGCAGNARLQTPHLDRLAAEGVRFTNAFVTTSLCSPSRASLLTGCYAHRHGVLDNVSRDPDPACPTFAALLQRDGYETAYIGKWHMLARATPRQGFDHWVSFTGQGEYFRNTMNIDGHWRLVLNYVTDELTDHAVRFLERDHAKPSATRRRTRRSCPRSATSRAMPTSTSRNPPPPPAGSWRRSPIGAAARPKP